MLCSDQSLPTGAEPSAEQLEGVHSDGTGMLCSDLSPSLPAGAEPSAEQLEGVHSDGTGMPAIRHKSVEYVGMFEYKKEDEELLIRSLIFGELPTSFRGLPVLVKLECSRPCPVLS